MARKKSLKERIIHKYYRCLWKKWAKSNLRIFIKKHLLTIIITISVFSAIFFIKSYLFLSPANAPQGQENIRFSTTLEAGVGVNVSCRRITEDYKNGIIIMYINFEKEEENKNKIYFDTWEEQLPSDWMEKSYMELCYSITDKIKIPLEVNEELYRPKYYFDLNKSKDEEFDVTVTIYIHVGEDFFPTEKEIVTYNRYINFPKPNCNLEVNSTEAHFLFSPDWKISYTLGDENNIIPAGGRNFVSRAKNPNKMTFYIVLDRNVEEIALNITKIGILMTLIFAGITLILSIYLYEKKQK